MIMKNVVYMFGMLVVMRTLLQNVKVVIIFANLYILLCRVAGI